MRPPKAVLRTSLKSVLKSFGLLPAARRIRCAIAGMAKQEPTGEKWVYDRFVEFNRQYGHVLRHRLRNVHGDKKKALVVSIGFPQVEFELGLIKGVELAGYAPTVLVADDYNHKVLRKYYRMAAVEDVLFWHKFSDPPDLTAAERVIQQHNSVNELLQVELMGARVAKFAVSTALRKHKLNSLNLQSSKDRELLTKYLALAMTAVPAAQRIVTQVHPDLVLFVDRVYSPIGELVDVCLARNIPAIRWDKGHKNNALVLKRYDQKNRDEHPESLSEETWELLRKIEWTDGHRQQLHRELFNCYATGDWYSQCATQYDKRLLDVNELRKRLGLDRKKKTAFIFPHILWDSSHFFGEDLFTNYEEWLVETVRAACVNDRVNWVIKIHPAHVGKNVADGFQGDPAEVIALRKYIPELPPHVFLMQPETDVNTFSLFEIMDYCVTVRGTIGIEAARLGIPVLTAGTGRYDRRGFTIDSVSREQYLEKLASIQEIPRLSTARQELAERFAYGLFVLRQFPLKTVTLEYLDATGINRTQINIKSKRDWSSATDLKAFARWVNDSHQSDFLVSAL